MCQCICARYRCVVAQIDFSISQDDFIRNRLFFLMCGIMPDRSLQYPCYRLYETYDPMQISSPSPSQETEHHERAGII